MTSEDFRHLVAEMRHAQREYFRTRSPTSLEAAKRTERAVDEELKQDGQKRFFGD